MRKIYRGLEYNKFNLLFIIMSVMLLVFFITGCTNHTSETDEAVIESDTIKVDTGIVENNHELIAQ